MPVVSSSEVNARIPKFEGKHLWVLSVAYRIVDPEEFGKTKFQIDHENLLMANGPGCFHCYKMYSPREAVMPCEGDPESEF